MKYIIYLRASDPKQEKRKPADKQKDDGLGIQAQRYACIQYIERMGGGEYIEFKDIRTGTDKKCIGIEARKQLSLALDSASASDIFLVAKRDRLARDPFVCLEVERRLKKCKASLICLDCLSSGNRLQDELMNGIVDNFARYEAGMISERIKKALDQKKLRGERMGHIPFGYKCNGSKLIKDKQEQITLGLIQMFFAEKMTCREVAGMINSLKRPTRSGRPWTYGAVNRIYKNNKAHNG